MLLGLEIQSTTEHVICFVNTSQAKKKKKTLTETHKTKKNQ